MPGRSYNSTDYRYGFQGQEKDDEIKGNGNSVNFKFRMYDPRLGRFFSTDPREAEYVSNSPCAFSGNRVIDAIELEGKEPLWFMEALMGLHGETAQKITTGNVIAMQSMINDQKQF